MNGSVWSSLRIVIWTDTLKVSAWFLYTYSNAYTSNLPTLDSLLLK